MESSDLKKAGLKVTLPRMKILDLMESSTVRHQSAEDIYQTLRDEGEEVGLGVGRRPHLGHSVDQTLGQQMAQGPGESDSGRLFGLRDAHLLHRRSQRGGPGFSGKAQTPFQGYLMVLMI